MGYLGLEVVGSRCRAGSRELFRSGFDLLIGSGFDLLIGSFYRGPFGFRADPVWLEV